MITKHTNYSDLKALCHTEKLNDLLTGKRSAPVYVRLKPTNVCNQKCFYCAYASNPTSEGRCVEFQDYIPWETMKTLVSDMVDMNVKALTLSGGGDPLCYRYIEELFELLNSTKLDLSIITNGQGLNKKLAELIRNFKWVRFSVDAGSALIYEKNRGVRTFDLVMDNIAYFCKIKNPKCVVGINFVVTKDNYGDIVKICEIAKRMGVNNIKFAPLILSSDTLEYHKKIENEVTAAIQEAIATYANDDFSIINKYNLDASTGLKEERPYEKCYITEYLTVVGADSNVYKCHQVAYTEKGKLGSISDKGFKNLWFDEDTIEKVKNYNCKENCRMDCVYDNKNCLLNDLIELDKDHINFI